MKNIGVNDLKKYLKIMDQKGLEEEIVNLFKTFPAVKEYYSSRLNPASDAEMLEKYKKKISKEFLPVGNRFSLKYKNCRDAIKEFEKVCADKKMVAELMFHYADEGVDFTETYGDIDEQFYDNIFNAYLRAVEYVFNNNIEEGFRDRAYRIMDRGKDIAWGFGDGLVDCYYDYYGGDE